MWFIQEISYTLKLLKKNLYFSLFCILVIAFGMAISLTLFSIVNNTGYKTLEYPGGERFVVIKLKRAGENVEFHNYFDAPRLRFLQENSKSFEMLGAVRATENVNILDEDLPQVIMAARIDPAVMMATRVNPVMGRGLQPADSEAGESVAVISHSLWQNYYAGRMDIIGHSAMVDGESRTVIGVMPEGFGFPLANDLWMPLRLENLEPGKAPIGISAVGLLKSDVSMEDARAELEILSRQYNDFWAGNYEQTWLTTIRPYTRFQANAPDLLLASMSAVSVAVLLLVAFNIGNMLIYRASERGHELSLRKALGASPLRCMVFLVQESFLICLAGGLYGLVLAHYFLQIVDTTARSELGYQPFWINYAIDFPLIVISILAVILLWLFSSLPFASKVMNAELLTELNSGSKGSPQRTNVKVTSFLVALEVLFSCFLLIVTVSFIFAIYNSLRDENEFGVDVDNIFVSQLSLASASYASAEGRESYYRNLKNALEETAGIAMAEFSTELPGNGATRVFYNTDDRDLSINDEYPSLFSISVSPGYFDLLNIALVAGTSFSAGQDDADSASVAIIEERLANYLWPDESAVGKRIQLDPALDGERVTIVGVVSNVEHDFAGVALTNQTRTPALYRPFSQTHPADFFTIIKSSTENLDYGAALRTAASAVDRNTPLANWQPISANILESSQSLILLRNIFIMASIMAILLSACAIYGVMARATLSRARETGIRRALGCTSNQIVLMFIKESFRILSFSLLAGSTLGIVITNFGISRLIPSTQNSLPLVSVAVVALLACVVTIATLLPSLKVISMEPGDALHHE